MDAKQGLDFLEIAKYVGVVIVIIGSLYGLHKYLDWRIEVKVKDPKFLNKILRALIPSLIFDQNETIISDDGAMDYIVDFSVKLNKNTKDVEKITINTNKFLPKEPLLESLDTEYKIEFKRGAKNVCIFELNHISKLLLKSSAKIETQRFKFTIRN